MPSARAFLLLGLTTLLVSASVVSPALARLALAVDLAVLALAAVDLVRARRTPLTASRRWPAMLMQGTDAEIAVTVRAGGARRAIDVRLREALGAALSDAPRRRALRLAGGRQATWTYTVRPRRRGRHQAGPLVARVAGPWGLAWAQRTVLAAETVRIYPQVRWEGRVGRLLLLAHRQALGRNPRRLRGLGSEPYALRAYLPGDPPTRIHWKASARHGTLISREDTWERGARLIVLLDCGRGMAGPDAGRAKLDHALAAALALGRVAAARGDRVTFAAFAERVVASVRIRAQGGSRGIAAAYAALYDLEAGAGEPAYDLAAETVAQLETRRSTVVLFTSVVDLAAAELLRRALLELERRHRPVLVNLQDPELAALARAAPSTPATAFAKAAALDILRANRDLGRRLRHAGIRVVSTPSDRLALETLETYLTTLAARAA